MLPLGKERTKPIHFSLSHQPPFCKLAHLPAHETILSHSIPNRYSYLGSSPLGAGVATSQTPGVGAAAPGVGAE